MEERKFKVGDRVVGIGEYDSKNIDGLVGTIRDLDTHHARVEFDKNIGGHSCSGMCKDGHGWFTKLTHLKPLTYKENWKVVIIPEGDKTLGRLYENGKVVKSVETKKHPDDEYSVEIATKTIMERLFPKYHIEPYLGIWCETEEECETLKRELDKRGYKWNDDSSLITGKDLHKPKCRYHLRGDKRVTATTNKDYKHHLDGKYFTDIDFKDLSFDDFVEPKEPEFKVGDTVQSLDNYLGVPKGAKGIICDIDFDLNNPYTVDFKFEYDGTHHCVILKEPTGLFLKESYFKKVD